MPDGQITGKDEIAEVVRYIDAESEEFEDMPRFWTRRGVDPTGIREVAMQRGLRVVMMRKGISPNQTKHLRVALNRQQQTDQVAFGGMYMDGFAAGWDARGRHDALES